MMDPLSITASIITLLSGCAQASEAFKKIRRLKEAPAVIQALNNEVSDLHLIILDISDAFEKARLKSFSHVDRAVLERFSSIIKEAGEKIQEVERLVHYSLLKPGKEAYLEVNKRTFLKEHDNLLLLQAGLRDIRAKIIGLYTELSIKKISRVEILLESMSNDLPLVMQSQARMERTLHEMKDYPLMTSHGFLQSPQAPTLLASHRPEHPENSDSSSIAIALIRHRHRCSCSRHTKSLAMQSIFGSLFIGYAATPVTTSCDHRNCSNSKGMAFYLWYFFPLWFFKCVLYLQAQIHSFNNINCSLNISPRISENHMAYEMILDGNLQGIRNLLVKGQVSLDAHTLGFGTMLHASIVRGKPALTKALIDMGADIHSEHPVIGSPQKFAWTSVFRDMKSAKWRETMKSLFPDPDLEELYGFPRLHRAVLGLANESPESIVQTDAASEIDRTDCDGRTALSWAAARGDSRTVRMLLSYQSDYNKAAVSGQTPISFAARQSRQCTDILLQAGSDIHTHDQYRQTPLMQATYYLCPESEALRLVKVFLQAGIDVNARDVFGLTALSRTYTHNHVEVAAYLIQQGADVDIPDVYGGTLLTSAVGLNRHGMLSMLLKHHADHMRTIEPYGTIVHQTAECSDAKALRILAQGGMRRRNINAKNKSGLTAVQIATQREDIDAEWRHAFFDFLRSVDEDQAQQEESSEELPAEGLAMPGSFW